MSFVARLFKRRAYRHAKRAERIAVPPATPNEHRCPECDRWGLLDARGYFYCDECGVSW